MQGLLLLLLLLDGSIFILFFGSIFEIFHSILSDRFCCSLHFFLIAIYLYLFILYIETHQQGRHESNDNY